MVRELLRERLLDHCESPRLWWETSAQGRRPVTRTVREPAERLGTDEDFVELTAHPAGGSSPVQGNGRYTPADFFRPSYWKQCGKFDIPNERFVSFGSAVSPLSPTMPIGWAGWNAHERVAAVLDLLEAGPHAHARRPESALPPLRALADLLPWVTASGDGPPPGSPSSEGP